MELIKIITNTGIPYAGIVALAMYAFLYLYRVFTSGELEKNLFHSNEKIINRILHNLAFYFFIFLFISVIFVSYQSIEFQINTGNASKNYNSLVFNCIIIFQFLVCIIFNKWTKIYYLLTKNVNSMMITIIVIILVNLILSIISLNLGNAQILKNYTLEAIIAIIILSFFHSIYITCLIKILFNDIFKGSKTIHHFIEEGNSKWYIIKPINDLILLGDHYAEEKCKRMKFIDKNEIKNKVINKEVESK